MGYMNSEESRRLHRAAMGYGYGQAIGHALSAALAGVIATGAAGLVGVWLERSFDLYGISLAMIQTEGLVFLALLFFFVIRKGR